jgi:predicted nucleic acid-binding protein
MDFFVLDACALIAFLRKEEGHEKIISIFDKANDSEAKLLMHSANLSEVYYDFWRRANKETADSILSDLPVLPIELINIISAQMIQTIGHFKNSYKISFADSFVLATAKLNGARIVTSDHHEFDVVEKSGDVAFEWIR